MAGAMDPCGPAPASARSPMQHMSNSGARCSCISSFTHAAYEKQRRSLFLHACWAGRCAASPCLAQVLQQVAPAAESLDTQAFGTGPCCCTACSLHGLNQVLTHPCYPIAAAAAGRPCWRSIAWAFTTACLRASTAQRNAGSGGKTALELENVVRTFVAMPFKSKQSADGGMQQVSGAVLPMQQLASGEL